MTIKTSTKLVSIIINHRNKTWVIWVSLLTSTIAWNKFLETVICINISSDTSTNRASKMPRAPKRAYSNPAQQIYQTAQYLETLWRKTNSCEFSDIRPNCSDFMISLFNLWEAITPMPLAVFLIVLLNLKA